MRLTYTYYVSRKMYRDRYNSVYLWKRELSAREQGGRENLHCTFFVKCFDISFAYIFCQKLIS